MRFLSITVENIGLFSGQHHFDLAPSPINPSARIVLVRGHNGAGKSTLFRSFGLALYGALSIGNRVTQADYIQYLYQRMHRRRLEGSGRTEVAREARIALAFEYIRSGEPVKVRIQRSWVRNGRAVEETIHVFENGAPPAGVATADLGHYLGELVPPGTAPLCFFDAERLETPPIGAQSRETTLTRTDPLVKNALRRLLGLDLVERLQADLDLYMARQGSAVGKAEKFRSEVLSHQANLEKLREELEQLEQEKRELVADEVRLNSAIAEKERHLAAEGGNYTARRPALQQRLLEIDGLSKTASEQIEEMCSHLLPFALAPALCRQLAERLEREAALQRETVAGDLWFKRRDLLIEVIRSGRVFESIEISSDSRETITQRLLDAVMSDSVLAEPFQHDARVIHSLSESERDRLQGWISEVIYSVPQQARSIAGQLKALQEEYSAIEADLHRTPDDAVLAPIHASIVKLEETLTQNRERQAKISERIGAVRYQRDESERHRQRAADALDSLAADARRGDLAIRTRTALRSYREVLVEQRVAELAKTFTQCFNLVCQKEHLLGTATIDPESFSVSLRAQDGHTVDIASFSAGEQQIYHLTLLQALRIVSGRSLPLAIDTPVARLDDAHRERLVGDYLPTVSEQVLLFGTDVEFNEPFLRAISPSVARCYSLAYNAGTQSTDVEITRMPFTKL